MITPNAKGPAIDSGPGWKGFSACKYLKNNYNSPPNYRSIPGVMMANDEQDNQELCSYIQQLRRARLKQEIKEELIKLLGNPRVPQEIKEDFAKYWPGRTPL